MVFRIFLDKIFFLQVAIVLTCFQSKKSQNKLDLMQSVLLKRFTKPVEINLRGVILTVCRAAHWSLDTRSTIITPYWGEEEETLYFAAIY